MNTKQKIKVVELAFAAVGKLAMYGGGKKSKGHGFWIYESSIVTAVQAATDFRAFLEAGGLQGMKCIENDGKASGNSAFWMYDDALELLGKEIGENPTL